MGTFYVNAKEEQNKSPKPPVQQSQSDAHTVRSKRFVGAGLVSGLILTILLYCCPLYTVFPANKPAESPITLRSISASYSDPISSVASQRVEVALERYKENDFKKALVHIESILDSCDKADSYSKKEKATVYAFQGKCHEKLGDESRAITSYKRFLAVLSG
jgi:Tfp pilus assembly protein PilF